MDKEMHANGEHRKKKVAWAYEDSHWKAEQILKIGERNELQPNSVCEVG
jgi:hypothetical protein